MNLMRNRGEYRTVYDIIYEVLSYAQQHKMTKTDIYYAGRLSFYQFNKIYPLLMQTELIAFNDKAASHLITEKGKQYMVYYEEIKTLTKGLITKNKK